MASFLFIQSRRSSPCKVLIGASLLVIVYKRWKSRFESPYLHRDQAAVAAPCAGDRSIDEGQSGHVGYAK